MEMEDEEEMEPEERKRGSPHQRDQAQHGQAVLGAAAAAGVQLLQAVAEHGLAEPGPGLQAHQQHAHALVPRRQDRLREQHLLGRGHARQHPAQNLGVRARVESGERERERARERGEREGERRERRERGEAVISISK